MSTKTRLIALLLALLLAFGVGAWLLRATHRRETAGMVENIRRERSALLDRLLTLTGQSLKNFSTDYARWDEMVAFVDKRDPDWAHVNIDESLPNFNAHAAWVLRPDGKQIYGAVRELPEELTQLPLPTDKLGAALAKNPFGYFFLETQAGLLEVRAAPIQPSADIEHRTAPVGWFVVARLWNAGQLDTLSQITESRIQLAAPTAPAPPETADGINLERVLPSWDGQPLRHLRMFYHPEPVQRLLADHDYDTILFYGFGLAMIAVTFAGVSRWMIRPLGWLEDALQTGRAEPLAKLRGQKNEFGHLAGLVETSFQQRATLEHEVEERKNAEAALRRSEESLRNSMDLRSRLARDLHDGVIQSIYAAGLGLESVRAALRHNDAASAEPRLSACQTSLNRTIQDVRTFINGLEPEAARPASLADSLTALVTTMQALHPLKIDLELDASLAGSMSDLHELHLLQAVREAISNALRHGQASRIGVHLRPAAGYHSELLVTDNGAGFTPGERQGAGLGLENLATRAQEMNAELQIESAPGKGTRLILRFPSTNHPT